MITIFSTTFDPSTDDVMNWLHYYKFKIYRLNGEDFLNNNINENYLNEIIINTKSSWYRRHFRYDVFRNQLIEKYNNEFIKIGLINTYEILTLLSAEMRNFINSYYELFSHIPSLNNNINWHVNKQIVLKYAKSCKINVPEYIITNSKKELENFKNKYKNIITKSISDPKSFTYQKKDYYLYTSEIREEIDNFNDNFFPSFFQRKIEKLYEIRIFVIDKCFYSMAIFSQKNNKTKLDFRNYDDINPNRFVPYKLEESTKEKLLKLLSQLNLDCCSIDLIKGKDGKYYFLEVNPVGQFGFVSHYCNYNIEMIIAKSLIKKTYNE